LESIIDVVLLDRPFAYLDYLFKQYFFASPLLHLSNDLNIQLFALMIMEEIKNMVK